MSQKGGSSGLIATSSITHATPASFYAHHSDRNDHEIIASFLPESRIDFFAAAGLKYFNDRNDQVNLIDTFVQKGFIIETRSLKAYPEAKKLGYLLADKDMPTMIEGRGPFLEDASKLAIDHLSKNEQGFFLMVEGSQVDWGGHDNDFDYMISELIDLDNTLGSLMAYARKDQNTLIVVTGDHATGGLALSTDNGDYNTIKPSFSSTGHNADWIPVFAYGPGAELFSGVYENNMIFHKIKALLSDQK
jgi:alkaline phosphatase